MVRTVMLQVVFLSPIKVFLARSEPRDLEVSSSDILIYGVLMCTYYLYLLTSLKIRVIRSF